MYEEKQITGIYEDDSKVPNNQGGTRLLVNPSSLSGSQPPYRAGNHVPSMYGGKMVTSDLRIKFGVDDTHSPLSFDTCIQPGMMTFPIPMSPAAQGYPLEDIMGSIMSSQSHQNLSIPSKSAPSPRLESSATPRRGVPALIKAYAGGPSRRHYATTRHHRIPPVQPYGNSGGHSDVMSSTPLPYASPDNLVNKTRRLHHSAQRHIQARRQYGSRDLFKLNSSLVYDAWLPEPARGQDTTLFYYAFLDDQNDDLPHHHVTLESRDWSDGERIPSPHTQHVTGQLQDLALPPQIAPGGQDRVLASSLLQYPPYTMADEIWLPQVSPPGHCPAHQFCGQAPLAIAPTPGQGDSMASSSSFTSERYSSPLKQPATCEGSSTPSSTATVPTRTHTDPSSGQYPNQALSPFRIAAYRNDMVVSASSTPSIWGSVYSADWTGLDPRPNDAWILHGVTQSQVSDQLLPSHTPPELGNAPPATLYPMNDGAAVPFPASAAEKRDNSSAVCFTALSAQGRLEEVLGSSSQLNNKALLRLLLLIIECSFIRTHEMEPIITSDEGQALLGQVQSIPDCPLNALQMSKCSIFTLFVAADFKFRCLICGSSKQSMARGIGCVRSHLNHRPYPCHREGDCDACPKDRIVKRFFTASLLRDHCNRQERETECTSCGVVLTSSMKRHWGAKHPETPFPCKDYPNYRKE